MTSAPQGDTPTRDEELLADLFDTLLQDILEGRTPDLAALHPDRPELRARIAETWKLACSVAGRREPSRPVLGGYEIVRELGHGGMGTVYLARHQTLQRDVAIKVLPHSLAMSPRAKERFLEEARALARIRHANVVHIHRIVDHAEMLAFEMEFIDGPSLQALILALRQKPKPFALATLVEVLGIDVGPGVRSSVEWFVRLGIRIARALAEVHRHGLVHRDVKPSNILLRRDGTPVLADFGLALQGDLDRTRTQFAGTPVYAAPERLRGGDGRVDARTDVYSLGVTLYEAFTSNPPFAGSSTNEVLRRIEDGNTPSLRERAPHVSHDLSTIIAKAIEPDPRRRYATADEFADDLERLLNLQPIQARPAGPLRRLGKLLRRNQKLVLAATAGAMLVALAVWPMAAHANARATARARSAAALHLARCELLCPETLPSSWSPARDGEQTVQQARTVAARGRAFERALAHYRQAIAGDPDDARLRLEHDVIAAVAALHGLATAPAAAPALPPLCRHLAARVRDHERLADGLGEALAGASDLERFAGGLLAFLCGDYAVSTRCWAELGPALHDDPLVDACSALRLAGEGAPERAYPRLFHAARAFPGALALGLALADAALAVGDLPLAEQWIRALPEGGDEVGEAHRRLLAADLSAAGGDLDGARRQYRALAIDDPTDPTPLLRVATLSLRSGDRTGATRVLAHLLARWPDLAQARQMLARMALQQRDTATYLSHARHALGQLRRQATPATSGSLGILRLGGLHGLYDEMAPAHAGQPPVGRDDDSLPLATWLPPDSVAGIEQVLRLLASFDEAAERASRIDPRPLGVGLRSVWAVAAQLPQVTARLPWPLPAAAMAAFPTLLGWPTDWLAARLLPYQRVLGTRLHSIPDRRLFRCEVGSTTLAYGAALLRVDDLDGDTLGELLVGCPPSAAAPGTGVVEVRSLVDGSLLRTWRHDGEHSMFGRALASLGDVDGDLCDDVLVGVPLARYAPGAQAAVELWSGRTGRRLWKLEDPHPSFGVAVAALGDVDGDGVRDFAVGSCPLVLDADAHGIAYIGSGRTGTILHELPSDRGGVWFGACVANAGDANGDGTDDVAVGGNFGAAPGFVVVFDGRTGARLTTFQDGASEALFGQTVAGCGDLDGDGRAELLVASPGTAAPHEAGRVLVFGSRTGRTLYELRGERHHEGFGSAVLCLPDWTTTRAPALAVASESGGPVGTGYLRVFDLRSGSPLQTFAGTSSQRRFAYSLVDLGDRDRDGLRDLGLPVVGSTPAVDLWALSWADAFAAGAPPAPRPQAPPGVLRK